MSFQKDELCQMDLDSFQDEIGGISKYQTTIICFVCIPCFGTALASQSVSFISAVLKHRQILVLNLVIQLKCHHVILPQERQSDICKKSRNNI